MKHASGKSNLSILQDYVNGDRPFTQVSLSGAQELANRKEGEEWTDLSGKKWKKQNGCKVSNNKKSLLIVEERCMLCNTDVRWGNRYDKQVWPKSRKCYDCFVEFESLLKLKGLYTNFIRNRDLINLNGYLIDFKSKLQETIAWCESPINNQIKYVNDDGTDQLETWTDDTDARLKIKIDASNDLKLVNDRLKDIKEELASLKINTKAVKLIEKELIKKYKKGRPHVFNGVRLETKTDAT